MEKKKVWNDPQLEVLNIKMTMTAVPLSDSGSDSSNPGFGS